MDTLLFSCMTIALGGQGRHTTSMMQQLSSSAGDRVDERKGLVTREEFEEQRRRSARRMAADAELQRDALDVLVRADRQQWIHQTNWFGEPILNLPQDMFALQEIIFRTRPEFILEIGAAWGGSLLFYATLMEVLGGEKIVAVDTYVPDDLRQRIGGFGAMSDRIVWVVGFSTAAATLQRIGEIVGGSRRVLVVLDSDHSREHVLQELRLYSPLVGKGHYLVCCDTIVEDIPPQAHRPRPWGPGNNPRTALDQFLQENDRFEIDRTVDQKLLFTCNPGGYLVCRKD